MHFLNNIINKIKVFCRKFLSFFSRCKYLKWFVIFWLICVVHSLLVPPSTVKAQSALSFSYNDELYSVVIPSLNEQEYKDYVIFKNNDDDINLYIAVTYNVASYCNLSPFYSVSKNWVQLSFDSKATNFSLFRFNVNDRTLTSIVTNYNLYEIKWNSGTWTNTVIDSSLNVWAKSRDSFGASGDSLWSVLLPFIQTPMETIRDLSFKDFVVNGGSYKFDLDKGSAYNSLYIYVVYDGVEYNYNNSDYFINIYDYLEVSPSGLWKLTIDRNFIFQKFLVQNNKIMNITVGFRSLAYNFSGVDYYEVSTGDFYVTNADVNAINNDIQRYVLEQQLKVSENAFNNANINNNIINRFMRGQVPELLGNLSVTQLFALVYQAFTVEEYGDLVIDIPFTDTPFVINAQNMVSHYPAEVVNLVHICWWGVFSFRFFVWLYGVYNQLATARFLDQHSTFIGNQSVKYMEDML